MGAYNAILSAIQLGRVEVPNRVVRASHLTQYTRSGQVTEQFVAYHEARARGGAGLSIMESGTIDRAVSPAPLDASTDRVIDGWSRVADAVQRHGMRVFAQLFHGGNQFDPLDGSAPWSASTIPARGDVAIVSMVRATIADPNLVRRAVAGSHPRPCIGCLHGCFGGLYVRDLGCTVNATVGREAALDDDDLGLAPVSRRVLVGRGDIGLIVDWVAEEIKRLGVDVRFRQEIVLDGLSTIGPVDAAVVATGSVPRPLLQIGRPSLALTATTSTPVVSSWELLCGPVPASWRQVVLVDDVGHMEAMGVAQHAAAGAEITKVLTAYVHGADRSDWDLVRRCYHPDAVDDHGLYPGDVDGLLAFLAELSASLLARATRLGHRISRSTPTPLEPRPTVSATTSAAGAPEEFGSSTTGSATLTSSIAATADGRSPDGLSCSTGSARRTRASRRHRRRRGNAAAVAPPIRRSASSGAVRPRPDRRHPHEGDIYAVKDDRDRARRVHDATAPRLPRNRPRRQGAAAGTDLVLL
jgi:NADH:flavin oxidoreductase / NADH oxidase family/SnoaL-like domain